MLACEYRILVGSQRRERGFERRFDGNSRICSTLGRDSYSRTPFSPSTPAKVVAGPVERFLCPQGPIRFDPFNPRHPRSRRSDTGRGLNATRSRPWGLGLGGNESYPDLFQPFGGFPDGVRVEAGHVVLPDLPGIGFEGKADLSAVMRELAE